jgi:hypothetical protein
MTREDVNDVLSELNVMLRERSLVRFFLMFHVISNGAFIDTTVIVVNLMKFSQPDRTLESCAGLEIAHRIEHWIPVLIDCCR